jgi:hypothetical protein
VTATRNPAARETGRACEAFILVGELPEDTGPALRVQGNVIEINPGVIGAGAGRPKKPQDGLGAGPINKAALAAFSDVLPQERDRWGA